MPKRFVYISDFFADHVLGGGELNDKELINLLRESGHSVVRKQSHLITDDFIERNKNKLFIISNFINLAESCKAKLTTARYIIYEHDHKYLKSRNPATYPGFKAPHKELINYTFYKGAAAVVCQSSFHKDIVISNTDLANVVSIGGNLWSLKQLDMLRTLSARDKAKRCSIMDSRIDHKNTVGSIKYCNSKEREYELIPSSGYEEFLERLGSNDTLVFFPKTPETLSRIVVEARMMGMSVTTNNMVGATGEDWFKMKGPELIDFMISKRSDAVKLIENVWGNAAVEEMGKPKEITIISTFHEGGNYLEYFLEDITRQTIFDKCELLFIDANSPGSEREIIETYMTEYDNIKYYRLAEREPPTKCINLAIKKSNGRFLTLGNIDDRRRTNCLETLYNALLEDDTIDLVYGDSYQTSVANETFEQNSSEQKLTEHSRFPFSRENMIKCLPGPIPLWRKSMHDRNGMFDQEGCDFADDWEMWLRAVESGSEFKKIEKPVGLYYDGGRSNQEHNTEQRREESRIFYQYSDVFGSKYAEYEPYFRQFI